VHYIPADQQFVKVLVTRSGFEVITTKRQPDHQTKTYSIKSISRDQEVVRIVEMFNVEEEPVI